MNKFIQEGLDAGHEFIIIEPQEGYNEAIVAFDKGRLVYDTEKLMNVSPLGIRNCDYVVRI